MVATQATNLNSSILEARNLSVGYFKRAAIENINLQIPARSITAIVGPSGVGKSTFLTSLNRLVELSPGAWSKGEILFHGKNISEVKNLQNLRREIGLIFQRPTVFPVSIFENVALALREMGVKNTTELADRVESALKDAALWSEVCSRMKEGASRLSGGQQQRLCIARALALSPQVLLMDEPCSALDPISTAIIEELMLSLKQKITLVLVTHNLFQARRVADHTALFWAEEDVGRLVDFGSTQKIWSSPNTSLARDYFMGSLG